MHCAKKGIIIVLFQLGLIEQEGNRLQGKIKHASNLPSDMLEGKVRLG